jgi:hypothetical protein
MTVYRMSLFQSRVNTPQRFSVISDERVALRPVFILDEALSLDKVAEVQRNALRRPTNTTSGIVR